MFWAIGCINLRIILFVIYLGTAIFIFFVLCTVSFVHMLVYSFFFVLNVLISKRFHIIFKLIFGFFVGKINPFNFSLKPFDKLLKCWLLAWVVVLGLRSIQVSSTCWFLWLWVWLMSLAKFICLPSFSAIDKLLSSIYVFPNNHSQWILWNFSILIA